MNDNLFVSFQVSTMIEDGRAPPSKQSPEASADRPLSLRRAVTSFLDAEAQEEFFECGIDGLSETSFEVRAGGRLMSRVGTADWPIEFVSGCQGVVCMTFPDRLCKCTESV